MTISPQRLTIYLHSAHRAVIFAIAQLSCIICRPSFNVGTAVVLPYVSLTRAVLVFHA